MSESISPVHATESLPRRRDRNFTIEIYESDNYTPVGLVSGDVVRFKIWDSSDVDLTPTVDIDSVTLPSATFTADAGTDAFTSAAHGLSNGDRVVLTTSGTLPAGLSTFTPYYVVGATTNTYQVALTSGGSAINFTSAGSGNHTWTKSYSRVVITTLGTAGTSPATCRVELHRDEINGCTAGEWDWEASVVMPAENNRIFVFGQGTFDVTDNAAGDIGIT